jgi:hypothetical protein
MHTRSTPARRWQSPLIILSLILMVGCNSSDKKEEESKLREKGDSCAKPQDCETGLTCSEISFVCMTPAAMTEEREKAEQAEAEKKKREREEKARKERAYRQARESCRQTPSCQIYAVCGAQRETHHCGFDADVDADCRRQRVATHVFDRWQQELNKVNPCLDKGLCKADRGICVPTVAGCLASRHCRIMGDCSVGEDPFGGKECRALTDADCANSTNCTSSVNDCVAKNGDCVTPD